MITSSRARSGASAAMVSSTTAAGTMSQTARGGDSFPHQLRERAGADGAGADQRLHLLRMPIEGDDLVTRRDQALRHVGAHSTESDHSEFHRCTSHS